MLHAPAFASAAPISAATGLGREVTLDTETTGFSPEKDRIVEIGMVELLDGRRTGNTFHVYINPCMPVPQGAFDVHGLGDAFLADKPLFSQVAGPMLKFIGDAQLIIHNASFDLKMLNAELARISVGKLYDPGDKKVTDTLKMAREKYPGSPASLDALCRRLGVDNSHRVQHGALLDADLLVEVYLGLTGRLQRDLLTNLAAGPGEDGSEVADGTLSIARAARPVLNALYADRQPRVLRATEEELAVHSDFLRNRFGKVLPMWRELEAADGASPSP